MPPDAWLWGMSTNAPAAVTTGQKIQRQREALDLSIGALARAVGVDRRQIQRWEHGENEPRPPSLRKLGAALNVHWTTLLDDVDD